MATKKTAPKASAKKKMPTKVAEPPVEVVQAQIVQSGWSDVVPTAMKKPKSWQDWQARQLDANRLK